MIFSKILSTHYHNSNNTYKSSRIVTMDVPTTWPY